MIRTTLATTTIVAALGVGVLIDGHITHGLNANGDEAISIAYPSDPKVEISGDTHPSDLEVRVYGIKDDGFMVGGNTSLPKDMKLTVTVSDADGEVIGEGQATVASSHYRAWVIVKDAPSFPTGNYQISITSPLIHFQPSSVSNALGDRGGDLPESIRRSGTIRDYGYFTDYDYYVVDHSVKATIGG